MLGRNWCLKTTVTQLLNAQIQKKKKERKKEKKKKDGGNNFGWHHISRNPSTFSFWAAASRIIGKSKINIPILPEAFLTSGRGLIGGYTINTLFFFQIAFNILP